MANEIGLTWEELTHFMACLLSHPYDGDLGRIYEVVKFSKGKSGPINIVEEEFVQADVSGFVPKLQKEDLRCLHDSWVGPGGELFSAIKCGENATHKYTPSTLQDCFIPLCGEHAKLYE